MQNYHSMVWWSLLCVINPVSAAGAAAGAAAAGIPYWKGAGPINACTSEYTPMVLCEDKTPEDYTGYEIELFRKVAEGLGWQPSAIKWRCLPWDDMMQHLKSADGVCDVVVAGIDVAFQDAADGVDFTWPTYRNGLSVLISSHQAPQYNMWSFFSAFEWQVWAITAATAVVMPFVLWAIDWFAYCWPNGSWPQGTTEEDISISRYFWESVTRPMWMRGQTSLSWAGNLVITVYAFLIFILFALYVSYATTNLTSDMIGNQITGIESLPGKAVGTWEDYSDKLRKKGVEAVTYKWDTEKDEQYMLQQLKSGAVKALVLDSSLVAYMASGDCDLTVVGTPIQVTPQATAFRRGAASKQLLDAYNAMLTNLINTGVVEELAASSLVPPDVPECDTLSEPSTAIRFHQVAGLWVITAASVAIAVIMVGLHILHVRYTRPIIKPIVDRSKHSVKQRLMNNSHHSGGGLTGGLSSSCSSRSHAAAGGSDGHGNSKHLQVPHHDASLYPSAAASPASAASKDVTVVDV